MAEEDLRVEAEQMELNAILRFDPTTHGLSTTFKLTHFGNSQSRCNKVAQKLFNLDEEPSLENSKSTSVMDTMNSCIVTPLRDYGTYLFRTNEKFYPIVNDPFVMGQIACASELSKLYSLGVWRCDNIAIQFGIRSVMTHKETRVIYTLLKKGFMASSQEADTVAYVSETTENCWCTIGGMVSTVCTREDYVVSNYPMKGDVIILTKPLGTQVALQAYSWLDMANRWSILRNMVSKADVLKAYRYALNSMIRLNHIASQLLKYYAVHAFAEITGFGLLHAADSLASLHRSNISFTITKLPIIAKMAAVAQAFNDEFQLFKGWSAEISGGLLLCSPAEKAERFIADMKNKGGGDAWLIGIVKFGNNTARIVQDPEVMEV